MFGANPGGVTNDATKLARDRPAGLSLVSFSLSFTNVTAFTKYLVNRRPNLSELSEQFDIEESKGTPKGIYLHDQIQKREGREWRE